MSKPGANLFGRMNPPKFKLDDRVRYADSVVRKQEDYAKGQTGTRRANADEAARKMKEARGRITSVLAGGFTVEWDTGHVSQTIGYLLTLAEGD